MINIFHGSIYDFDKIDLSFSQKGNDFGCGFYASMKKEHAIKMAKRNFYRYSFLKSSNNISNNDESLHAYVYSLLFYDLEAKEDKNLKIKVFKSANEEWLKTIYNNRIEQLITSDYDIIIGPTADARTVGILLEYRHSFEKGTLSNDDINKIISELKPDEYPIQYCFLTNASLNYLKLDINKRGIIL